MTDPRMTPTNDAPVTVEQCDHVGFLNRSTLSGRFFNEAGIAAVYAGKYDDDPVMQAIARRRIQEDAEREPARHRLAALASAPAGDGYGKWHPVLLDLVNAIHRDRGEKTQAIGIDLSYQQALAAALARPRAAVGRQSQEAEMLAIVKRVADSWSIPPGPAWGQAARDLLALQSPPAKVEG